MSKLFDLTGMRFGRLVVLHRDFERKKDETRWICKCDCGAVKSINGISLKKEEPNLVDAYKRNLSLNGAGYTKILTKGFVRYGAG